jgi:hypothetical protein
MASSGAQAQVAVRGAQDVFLLAQDDLTFWKTSYNRCTNFAVTELEMPFNNAAGFGRQKFTCKISRSGDLLSQMYVSVSLPRIQYAAGNNFSIAAGRYAFWVNAIGHAMFNEIDINVGQHQFDSHYAEFLEIFESLSAPSDRLLSQMTGRYNSEAECAAASLLDQHLYVPLKFWFNRFTEQALPLVALYWHDTELTFSTKTRAQLAQVRNGGGALINYTIPTDVTDMHLLCNLVYLDRPERAAFANAKSEYVIDQVQHLGTESVTATSTTVNHNARFNHPVTEFLWAIRTNANTTDLDWFDFSGGVATIPNIVGVNLPTDPFNTAQILINNHERTIAHPAVYYRTVQPFQSHSRIPAPDRFVYCYSFGLKPEELLHTGSVNMSRLDNANLRIVYHAAGGILPAVDGVLMLYARNKNVVKTTVGMAGLKFAA